MNHDFDNSCIFCSIIKGNIQGTIVYEDDEFLAIMDKYPITTGHTLVIPKKHYDSYLFDMPDDVIQRYVLAAKKVAKLLDKKLGVQRTGMVMEGTGVNHVHFKLYPLHGLKEKFEEHIITGEFHEKYPGFIPTKMGPKADIEELNKLANEIRE